MIDREPTLVIMAAGMGSRFGGLKQMTPVDPEGHFIIDFSLCDAHRAGFRKVVFIIKREHEQVFHETIGRRMEPHFDVRYVYQELTNIPDGLAVPEGRVKPWGTAHAILSAADAIDAPFAVINADDYYGRTCFELIYNYLSAGHTGPKYPWVMVGYLLGNTVSTNGSVSRGVCVTDADGNLDTVTERTRIETYESGIHYTEDGGETWVDLPADTVVSMNMWGFTPDFITEAKAGFVDFLRSSLPGNPLKCEYYLPTVVTEALETGKAEVKVLTTPDKWHGITYREDKPELVAALAAMHASGFYPKERLF